jgi:molybdopterin molybdotransferase
VSAGDRDLVREVLEEFGVKQLFWKVDIKPGGPTAFGLKDGKPVFSLPGNPVSTLVTFEEFVRPALLRMMGHRRVFKPLVPVVLGEAIRKKPGKIQFVRLRLERRNGGWVGWSAGDQQTGILRTMVTCDALAVLPEDATEFDAGDTVRAHLLSASTELLES